MKILVHNTRHKAVINMLEGSLWDKIILFAIPLAVSSILQQLFNAADTAVVGRFASSQALAAVGANAQAIALLVNLFVGLSVGANVVVAESIGKREPDNIRLAIHTSISLALISGLILVAAGELLAPRLLLLMNTPEDILDLAVLYLRLYFLGMPFIMLYNFGAAVLRSRGDSQRPMICLIISGVINVILNLCFVIGLNMSVDGVALATVISNVFSAGLVMRWLITEEEPYRLNLRSLGIDKKQFARILSIGIPAGIQGIVFAISNVFIQASINSFGSAAIAGSATGLNFEFFSYFIMSAFVQAAVTFTGQNYAAREYERCKRIYRICMGFGALFTFLFCMIMIFFRGTLLRIFSTDSEVLYYANIRVMHVLTFEAIATSYEVSGGAMRGMGHSMLPTVLTIFGTCLLRLGLIFTVFAARHDYGILMNVYPISWVVTGIMVMFSYYRLQKKLLG